MLEGSIVALVTPMTADRSVDYAAWERLVDWHLEEGTHALVVAGTTGESPVLTAEEFERLLVNAVEQVAGRIPVLAGTGSAGTGQTIVRTRHAAELGADAALVVTPYYNRPPQRGLEAHFLKVAEASAIPVVLYNVPSRTAVDLEPETTRRLAAHENIIAIKEAVGDPERIAALIRSGITVLSGDDPSACRSMLAGARGVISVAANIVPGVFSRLCDNALKGRVEEAGALDDRLRGLYEFLAAEANPIPAKWLLARLGLIEAGIRPPLVELDSALHEQGARVLRQLELLQRHETE